MDSKVKDSVEQLKSFNASMKCAISKAENGSNAEDGYFMEKLEKTVNLMGFDLVCQNKAGKHELSI